MVDTLAMKFGHATKLLYEAADEMKYNIEGGCPLDMGYFQYGLKAGTITKDFGLRYDIGMKLAELILHQVMNTDEPS